MSKINLIITAILFYLGWFGSVISAQSGHPWLSFAFPAALVLFLFFKNLLSAKTGLAAFAICVFGIIFDSLTAAFGLIFIPSQSTLLIPVWLISIWLLFSFSMIKIGPSFKLPISIQAVLGFVCGPLSYKSGEAFGELSIASVGALLVYSIFWAIYFPLVIHVSKRLA